MTVKPKKILLSLSWALLPKADHLRVTKMCLLNNNINNINNNSIKPVVGQCVFRKEVFVAKKNSCALKHIPSFLSTRASFTCREAFTESMDTTFHLLVSSLLEFLCSHSHMSHFLSKTFGT